MKTLSRRAPNDLAGLRALARLAAICVHLLFGALILLLLRAWQQFRGPASRFPDIVRWWYRRLLPLIGVQFRQVDGVCHDNALVVANHISWLDVPVLGALEPVHFLSKSEVRRWPLIGWMSAQVGTLFIERGASQTTQIRDDIRARIADGQLVVIFPEGTTSDGRQLRRFHPRLFAAGQDPRVPVQPVAIRYGSNHCPDPVAAFIGDDSFVAHLWRVLRQPGLQVQVWFLDTCRGEDMDRRRLAANCEASIAQALAVEVEPRARRQPAPEALAG